jgi:hypothetical protein
MLRSVALPWMSTIDTIRVILFGYGGNETNWFMRVISIQDLAVTLLFIGLSILSVALLKPDLYVYLLVGMLLVLSSHGPYALGLYSASRYVLTLFPAFIVLGILLNRLSNKFKWPIWGLSAAAQFFLAAWFANGRWVA